MKYQSGERYDYIRGVDYGVLPNGEVVFTNKNIPDEIKERLVKDVQEELNNWLNPPDDEPILSFE